MPEVTLEVSTYLIEERSGQKGPDLDDDVFVDADDDDDGGGGQKSVTRSVLISTQIKTRTFTKFDYTYSCCVFA